MNYFLYVLLLILISYLSYRKNKEFNKRKKLIIGKNKYNLQKYKYK